MKKPQRPLASLNSGFTLVELLVVIVIIATLAAIGFPISQKMKQAADKTQCASRLRSWGIALGEYAGDNNGKVAWKNWAPIGWDPASSSPYIPYWTGASVDLAANEDGGAHKIQLSMRHCPAVPLPKNGGNPSVTYRMIRPTGPSGIVTTSDYALASITKPSRFMFMIDTLENSGAEIRGSSDFQTQVKPLTVKGQNLRHNHSVNALLGDFSVRPMTWPEIEKGLSYWATF